MFKLMVTSVPRATREDASRITVALDLREATALRAVLARVGGHPDGPRRAMDSISLALDELRVLDDRAFLQPKQTTVGAIYMADEWPVGYTDFSE